MSRGHLRRRSDVQECCCCSVPAFVPPLIQCLPAFFSIVSVLYHLTVLQLLHSCLPHDNTQTGNSSLGNRCYALVPYGNLDHQKTSTVVYYPQPRTDTVPYFWYTPQILHQVSLLAVLAVLAVALREHGSGSATVHL